MPANDNRPVTTMSADERAEYVEKLLAFARKHHRDKLQVSGLRGLVVDAELAKNPHRVDQRGRPVRLPGFVTLTLDDEAVRDLHPKGEGNDAWFLVRVRRSVLDKFESPIVAPEEGLVS